MSRHNHKRYYLGAEFGNLYLTRQETRCVQELLAGKKNKEIGIALGLTPRTVDFYLKLVRKKLNCRRRKELIAKLRNCMFDALPTYYYKVSIPIPNT